MFLNVFIRFCKFGKVRKTEETLADFPEKNPSVGKEKKKKFFLALRFRIIFKRYVKNCKGFAPRILIYGFKEKFLYPLECREVPSGS